MIQCNKCGTENPGKANFCRHCGISVRNPKKDAALSSIVQSLQDKNEGFISMDQIFPSLFGDKEGMSNARKEKLSTPPPPPSARKKPRNAPSNKPSTPPPPPSARKKPRNAPNNKPSAPPPPPPADSEVGDIILNILKVAVIIGGIIAIIALGLNDAPKWFLMGCCMGIASLAKAFWGD